MNFELKTLKNIRPGNYSIDIVFTYFNGVSWCATSNRVSFKVQNFLERHGTLIGWIAVVASILAIVLGILELREKLVDLYDHGQIRYFTI